MRKKPTQAELQAIRNVYNRLWLIEQKFADDRDVALKIAGNGTIADQLSCACAALCTILQEYE